MIRLDKSVEKDAGHAHINPWTFTASAVMIWITKSMQLITLKNILTC